MVERLEAARVLVVGLARSGVAAATLADHDGAEVWVTDQRPAAELGTRLERLPPGARSFLGDHPAACLEGVDLVVSSPGVAADAPILTAARKRDIAVLAEVEYAWLHAPSRPLVAVTGSNGKSTVTVLIAEMLMASGVAAVPGGNLGAPASELVLTAGWDHWVLEVSSFQAELLTAMRPTVGVFLNLSQDHLERHPDMASYLAAKQRLFAFQTAADAAVLNGDDEAVAVTPTPARRFLFSLHRPLDAWLAGDRLMMGEEELIPRDRVGLVGIHNVANGLAAALAAGEAGADRAAIVRVLESFQGLEHRHRIVCSSGGVRWVDDSKATNVGATLAALRGYPERSVHLILGGLGKGQDFSILSEEVHRAAAAVYLIGSDAPAIAAALEEAAPVVICGVLEVAVQRARAAAAAGQWVLLAPACASFDQFSDYAQRGDRFAALARREVASCP